MLPGNDTTSTAFFDIKNIRLKKVCKQVDNFKANDQEIIYRIFNMTITQQKIKQIIKAMC